MSQRFDFNAVRQRPKLQKIYVYHEDAALVEIFGDEEMATHLAALFPNAIIFITEE